MRFSTRAFLFSFLPLSLLLGASFFTVRRGVESAVRDGMRASLRENHRAVARIQSQSDLQNSRFLKVVGENAALKAGIQLLLENRGSAEARLTVEDQLSDMCRSMGFDLLTVSSPAGETMAAVIRAQGDDLTPLDASRVPAAEKGMLMLNGRVWQMASVPVDSGEENIGMLSVGERFDLSSFPTPAVLLHGGQVVLASGIKAADGEMQAALGRCAAGRECALTLAGANYLSLPIESASFSGGSGADGYQLRSMQNEDEAAAPMQNVLRTLFGVRALGALLAALLFSFVSSHSIARPLATLIRRLGEAEDTGELPRFDENLSQVYEVRELVRSFNRAASSILEGREKLHRAYLESVRSLAGALDARDSYTAGHSHRVADYAGGIAAALGLSEADIARIRIGAMLHDIGKIGISDMVLLKPGRLTSEEFAMVKEHPTIGKRILAGVDGFAPYLPAVELHHENWDGTGYPRGQKGAETPIDARIIHVADAFDAMTTDRPYRNGMSRERARRVLIENAGTQFDPGVVAAFVAAFPEEHIYTEEPSVCVAA